MKFYHAVSVPQGADVLLCGLQTEKLVPQPHALVAFGLWMRNEAPMTSSTKSISDPARKGTLASSMATVAPSRSITRSSAFALSAKPKR